MKVIARKQTHLRLGRDIFDPNVVTRQSCAESISRTDPPKTQGT